MTETINLSKEELIKLVGEKKTSKILYEKIRCRLGKKQVERIESDLTKLGVVTLNRLKSGRVEFVHKRFVEIKPRRHFEIMYKEVPA